MIWALDFAVIRVTLSGVVSLQPDSSAKTIHVSPKWGQLDESERWVDEAGGSCRIRLEMSEERFLRPMGHEVGPAERARAAHLMGAVNGKMFACSVPGKAELLRASRPARAVAQRVELQAFTRRLHLRVPQFQDCESLAALRIGEGDAEFDSRRWSGVAQVAEHIAAARQSIEKEKGVAFVIVERATEQAIGWVEARLARAKSETATISMWLAPGYRRSGLGIEAGRAAIPIITVFLKPKILWANVHAANQGAIHLLRRLGLRPTGIKVSRKAREGIASQSIGYCKDLVVVI
jgi:RimJ/RimL family protein N-acetyltransferase